MEKKRGPVKGAGRKWAARLKELGKQPPPQDLVDKINGTTSPSHPPKNTEADENKKIAQPTKKPSDLGL